MATIETTTIQVPRLEGEARDAVLYRGGHLQIIASAGSGKTEVVSQRVAALLAEGVEPAGIVAFTFTERAATSLKSRIERCIIAEPRLGPRFLDKLGAMFVGTIHSYCFNLLQQHVPRYETFDVLDDNRLTAFLTREAYTLGIPDLSGGKLFRSIQVFLSNLDVVENELIDGTELEDPFRTIYERYVGTLEENHLLTYGQMIAHAVRELARPDVFATAHGSLAHLIVDEYQDVNPAQEVLIERLAALPVHLCVVGDDDQSIYQWRGSTVDNIVQFESRYPGVRPFRIQTNRRSRPTIIDHANKLGALILGRLTKTMEPHRAATDAVEVVCWSQATPHEEARVIAQSIKRAHAELGYRFRDVAVLCRGRVSLPPILEALEEAGIPVQPGDRTNLFLQPEAELFGRTVCWLAGRGWRPPYAQEEKTTLDGLVERHRDLYKLDEGRTEAVRRRLEDWRYLAADTTAPANLVREWYDLLGDLGVETWDLSDPWSVNRLGTLARCSQVLADYEAARRRSRPDHAALGEQRGALDRGERYYAWLATYVQNWAQGAYEGFEGEESIDLDAVDLTTIHQAKGLEWPLVFVPALTDRRFPSSRTGEGRDWRVPTHLFDRARYEGSENDERRLFYVAMTRARECLSLSTFAALAKPQKPSRFLLEVTGGFLPTLYELPPPPAPEPTTETEEVLEVTFSELASFRNCGMAYRLRTLIGFQPPLVPELGYGKAVHHVLREVADHIRRHGRKPTASQLDRLFDDGFYLPAANRPGHRQMKASARKLVDRYLDDYEDDLKRVWAVERPFELHLGGATVVGRADVIIDESNGQERLTIVDYKTAADAHEQHEFQLQVYTDAGRREGLTVDRALVHDLRSAQRFEVPVNDRNVNEAEELVHELVRQIRAREFVAIPEKDKCGRCDVHSMCRAAAR
jgi:DNA helicase-2/ATP-dependent DNA helicase PcrA